MTAVSQGSVITLEANYVDGTGTAVIPTSPTIDIIDPSGMTIVNDAPVVPGVATGHYAYDFPVPTNAPLGQWTARWSGIINGSPVEAIELFTVVLSGFINFGNDYCATDLWMNPNTFVANHPEYSLEEAELAIEEASWMLWSLTGYRFSSRDRWFTDEYRNHPYLNKLKLHYTPVVEVFSIKEVALPSGVETDISGAYYLRGNLLRLSSGHYTSRTWGSTGCHNDDTLIKVEYKTAANLPPGAARVTEKLALEFAKSNQGKPCALPDRITSVNRQGVSWTILDPLDFLDKGLTGIGSVDQWITAANNKGYTKLIDPLNNAELVSSRITYCTSTGGTGTDAYDYYGGGYENGYNDI